MIVITTGRGANVTHNFVIRGLDEGVYVASPAVVRYRSSPKGAVQVGHSSTPSWPLYVLGSSFSAMRNRPSLVCICATLCYSAAASSDAWAAGAVGRVRAAERAVVGRAVPHLVLSVKKLPEQPQEERLIFCIPFLYARKEFLKKNI